MGAEDFYRASESNVKRTYIQGMPSRGEVEARTAAGGADDTASDGRRETEITLQERPLAGALFSASADGLGEIFPLYVGRNTIGSSPESDIYLPEATVAPNHAVILVRRIPDGHGGTIFQISLTDYDSEYGTSVGGERLGYDRCRLSGGETIRVGYAYTLMLSLFDSSKPGMGENPAFNPLERKRHRPRPEDIIAAMKAAEEAERIEIEESFAGSVGAEDEFAFYGRTKSKKGQSHETTVDNLSELYGQATQRSKGAAPGTVLK